MALSFDEMRWRVEAWWRRRRTAARGSTSMLGIGTCRRSAGFRGVCPPAEKRRSDGYDALGHLPAGRRERGKGSDANRNEGLRAKLRTRLNRRGRSTSGYGKKPETLANSLAPAWLRLLTYTF